MDEMLVLAIETSCDDTGAAVILDGRKILSNIVSSQIAIHQKYGGVVPELASRRHIESIVPIVTEALETAKESIILRRIFQLFFSKRTLHVFLLSVWSSQEAILPFFEWMDLESIRDWDRREMMRQARPSTKWQNFCDWDIQEDRSLTNSRNQVIRKPFDFPEHPSVRIPSTSVSVGLRQLW
jgi:hypothetical protein